jgi:hypothetical protein
MPLDPAVEAELRSSPELKLAMLAAAAEAQQMAITFCRQVSRAPWMLHGGHTWEQAIKVVDAGDTVLLVNRDSAGHLYEFGSINSPPSAPLRRAVRAVGMALVETPKP